MAHLTSGKDQLSSSQGKSHAPNFGASTQGAAGGTLGDPCSMVLQRDTGNFGSIYGKGDALGAGDKDMAQATHAYISLFHTDSLLISSGRPSRGHVDTD